MGASWASDADLPGKEITKSLSTPRLSVDVSLPQERRMLRGENAPLDDERHGHSHGKEAVQWGVNITSPIYRYILGGTKRPFVYEVKSEYPEFLVFEDNFALIKEELLTLLQERKKQSVAVQKNNLGKQKEEKRGDGDQSSLIFLKDQDFIPEHTKVLCPQTLHLLNSIPSIQQAYFILLEDGKSFIPPQSTDMTMLLYQLTFLTSPVVATKLKVQELMVPWVEGKSVLLDPTWSHAVVNKSIAPQVTLVLKVQKKLTFYQSWTQHIIGCIES